MEEREMSEEAFKRAVKQRRKEKDMSFVLAVYRTYDEFLKKEIQDSGVKLACGKGCCSCCYQLISCTEMEISEVFRYINKIPRPRRRSLIKRLKKKAKEWQNYYQGNEAALEIDPFKPVRDWWGRPCPFLNEETGSCDIYSVRIIDCRTLSSLIPCTLEMETAIPCELHTEGPGRFRFKCDGWANSMILEEQQKKLGLPDPRMVPVTPVHHWLAAKLLNKSKKGRIAK